VKPTLEQNNFHQCCSNYWPNRSCPEAQK